MTQPPAQSKLPPLLSLLRDTPPGAIYGLAAKRYLLQAATECSRAPITAVEWSADRSTLTVAVRSLYSSTFTVAGSRLVTGCSCPVWSPERQCHHVVLVWSILKRIVSPDTLLHIRFDDKHLGHVSTLLGLAPHVPSSPTGHLYPPLRLVHSQRHTFTAPTQDDAAGYRLIIERHEERLFGFIRKGNLPLFLGRQLPVDLRKFQDSHFFFTPTATYFSEFVSLPGQYPIVFRHGDGSETVLDFRPESPPKAEVTFELTGNAVTISRRLDGDVPRAELLIAGECLFDLEAGTVQPIIRTEAWLVWETVAEQLVTFASSVKAPYDNDSSSITLQAELFNSAAVRLKVDQLPPLKECCRFSFNDSPVEITALPLPEYRLELLDGLAGSTVRLAPVGFAGPYAFPIDAETFTLFSPLGRQAFSSPLKAKKRIIAMIDGAFAALDAKTSTAQAAAIRGALSGPDFFKRKIKSEAKAVIGAFVKATTRRTAVLQVGSDGWCASTDDHRRQARLMQVLYREWGFSPFTWKTIPGEAELPRQEFLARLGQFVATLQREGFGFRLQGEPLHSGEWEFTVEAAPHAIDWFELKPEIRCNGLVLTQEEIRGLLEAGLLRQGDACYLLDEEQRRILHLLSGSGSQGKKGRKQDAVRIPRLQILDWLELRTRGVILRLPPAEEQLLANLTRLEQIPRKGQPSKLTATLRHYQQEGYEWLAFLYQHRFGACLADDMGLGKTVQAIALLAGITGGEVTSSIPAGTPHLIVVPPSLLFNWEHELTRFAPSLKVASYTGQRRSADFAGMDVVLTSYGILPRDIDTLAACTFGVIVFDEAQQVKNLHTATCSAARRLKGSFKLALTGTPVENHLAEYHTIMDLCVPGLLGSQEEFRRRYDISGFGGIETLIRRTRPFVLRRTKQMIADELPPRIETDLYLELTPKQRALYQRTVEEARGIVNRAFSDRKGGQARMIALTAILRLRQICLCPTLIAPESREESPKLQCLADQLLELRDEGHSSLVFSQFTSYLDVVEAGLQRRGLASIRLDGSTPVARRKLLVNTFQESESPLVFLISLKAGGKGLNLTRATYVYHLDPWWNPAVENQASDRAHRIGQTSQVTITRLLMRHTVEEKMMALKERKSKLYQALLEDGTSAGGVALSREDFDFLLTPA